VIRGALGAIAADEGHGEYFAEDASFFLARNPYRADDLETLVAANRSDRPDSRRQRHPAPRGKVGRL
jgi:hypothetical protein